MNATLTIEFEDGTSKVIDLGPKCIEIDISPESRQSIAINGNAAGSFLMSFTKPLMDGKKFKSITIKKVTE